MSSLQPRNAPIISGGRERPIVTKEETLQQMIVGGSGLRLEQQRPEDRRTARHGNTKTRYASAGSRLRNLSAPRMRLQIRKFRTTGVFAMRLHQLLTDCFAAFRTSSWSSPAPAQNLPGTSHFTHASTRIRAGVIAAGLALFSLHGAVAQQTPAATDNSSTVPDAAPCTSCETAKPAIFILNPETIMGFENPIYWSVQSSGKPYSNVQSTPLRTEGSAALAVTNPPSQISLTSQSVGSATTALAGIANSGAVLQLDLRLQPQGNPLVPSYQVTAETTNTGKIEAFVSSNSRIRQFGTERRNLQRPGLRVRDQPAAELRGPVPFRQPASPFGRTDAIAERRGAAVGLWQFP